MLAIEPAALLSEVTEPSPVGMEVARRSRAQHDQWLIDVLRLRITRNHCARRVGLFHQIVSVVGIDAGGACGGRFVDSSSERVVLEAK